MLIAIEIFINITVYLREDVIHIKIVMATALMAISISYWLVVKLPRLDPELDPEKRKRKEGLDRRDKNAEASSTQADVAKPE